MELKDGLKIIKDINNNISKLEDRFGNLPEEFECNFDNPEEKYQHDRVRSIMSQLFDIKNDIEWMNKTVIKEGLLVKNSTNRYEIQGTDYEFSSGSKLDFWNEEWGQWETSTVEHNGGDYYIVSLGRKTSIYGVKVRKK